MALFASPSNLPYRCAFLESSSEKSETALLALTIKGFSDGNVTQWDVLFKKVTMKYQNRIKKEEMKKRFLWMFCLLLTPVFLQAKSNVTNMRVSGMSAPLGIDTTPTFGWQTVSDERGFRQTAYHIVVRTSDGTEVWNTGKVTS